MAKKKTSADVPAATMTRMQELGSAWVFKRAIQDNVTFNSANDIVNDKKTYDELVKIWKTVGKVDWDDSVDGGGDGGGGTGGARGGNGAATKA